MEIFFFFFKFKKTDLEGVETVLWMQPDFPRLFFLLNVYASRVILFGVKREMFAFQWSASTGVKKLTSSCDRIESKLSVAQWNG